MYVCVRERDRERQRVTEKVWCVCVRESEGESVCVRE